MNTGKATTGFGNKYENFNTEVLLYWKLLLVSKQRGKVKGTWYKLTS